MKRILSCLLLIAATLVPKTGSAQLLPPNQPEQDACNALLLCGNSFFTPYSYVGVGAVADLTSTPCGVAPTGGEGNSLWLRLNVNTGGTIVFTITPVNIADDYDFAVLDVTNVPCSTISPANVVRCNFNNNWPTIWNNGILGLDNISTIQFVPTGANAMSFLQQINALPGESYLVMVNNFGVGGTGGPSSGFTIDFTGSTATFNSTNPSMDYVVPSCNNSQQVTLQMNTNMKCNSIAANGSDFTISGGGAVVAAVGTNCLNPNGYTDRITLNFASPLPPGTYTLGVQNGIDGNTVLDLCNTPVPLSDTVQFVIDPYVPPAFVAIDTPACSEIRIKMNSRIRCDSIAEDGSDFAISGPQASNVIAAYGIGCDTLNFTDSVVLILQVPLQIDGVYTITAKKGTDGNTTMDSCGLYQPVGDLITMTINSNDGLVVSVPDSVLCQAQYIQLKADNFVKPPLSAVNCDVTPLSCNGSMYVAFAGTRDSSTNINTPFSGASQDARAQYLYSAKELRAMGLKAGSIQKLEWKVTQKLSSLPFTNFTLKIGCTPMTDMSSNYIGGAQTVYTDPAYNSTAGWNTFSLNTPYNWDGMSNLVVEVCYDNVGVSADDYVAHSLTNFSSVFRRFGNALSGCAITTEGSSQLSTTMRPRLRFYICEPPAGTPGFSWTPGTLLSDSTIQQPLAFVNRDVKYQVKVIDKYGCAHIGSSSFVLSVRQPAVKPLESTICLKESVQLEASGGVNYNWVAADPTSLSCLTCPDPIAKPVVSSVYNVIISDKHNCADTLTTKVNINPLPVIDIQPDEAFVKYGTSLQLSASGGYLYSWTPPSVVSDPNIVNPVAIITKPTVIVLTGIDEKGCRNTDTLSIGVDYTDRIFIPTAFSPNGDGKNDIFKIGSLSFQKLLEFRIFNRWGQEVFTTTDTKIGWDGKYKGVMQEVGLYHYLIRVAYPDSKIETYKGDVTLVL